MPALNKFWAASYFALAFLALPGQVSAAPPAIVTLGLDLGVSAKNEPVSKEILRAVRAAVDHHNHQGADFGRPKVALRVLDNRGNPERSYENLRKLSQDSAVGAILVSEHGTRVAELRLKIEKPVLTIFSGPIRGNLSEQIFRLAVPDPVQLALAFENAAKKGFKKTAVVLANTPRGRYCQESILSALVQQPSLQVVFMHWLNLTGNDYLDLAKALHHQQIQAVIWCAGPVQLKDFYHQGLEVFVKANPGSNGSNGSNGAVGTHIYVLADLLPKFLGYSNANLFARYPISGVAAIKNSALNQASDLVYWQAYQLTLAAIGAVISNNASQQLAVAIQGLEQNLDIERLGVRDWPALGNSGR